MTKIIKETSGLAIFSFLLAASSLSVPLIETYTSFRVPVSCDLLNYVSGIAVLSGVASLLYIKKRKLKGKWFGISAIILGIFGLALVC